MSDLTPCDFLGANKTMKSPENWDSDKYGSCEDLHIMERDGVSISCWNARWRDRLRFLFRGKVFLHVVGRQPPVMLVVE